MSAIAERYRPHRGIVSYSPPIANTPIRASLCLRGSWRELSTGMGKIKRVISVMRFIEALKNQRASKFRQCPGSERSQNFSTGMQFK